jgi:OmpA-OmpF porin, OOP family
MTSLAIVEPLATVDRDPSGGPIKGESTMRTLGFAIATAATIAASPATARDDESYVALEAGVIFPGDTEYELVASGAEILADPGNGWDADILVGHDFGGFRLEAEAGYKSFDIDSIVTGATAVPGASLAAPVTGTFTDVGDVTILSSMLNGLIDFGGNDGIGFSVGGGAGIAGVKTDVSANPSGPGFIDSEDIAFAWQGIAALRIPISNSVDLGIKYRYFNVEDLELTDTFGRGFESDITSHSVLASLIVNFGGAPPPPPPPAPPPPPPAPPPPPPPPQVRCNQGPFIVFFDWDKYDITPEATTILNNAVTAYANCGSAAVMIAGHADKSGPEDYNYQLGHRRADAVKGYMTGRGIPPARITTQSFGETMPRVPTADGVRELQNRRVEVTYGPGSGR